MESDSEGEVEGAVAEKGKGGLLPRPQFPGQTVVSFRIDKIVLKDSNLIMPFFTVYVKGELSGD